jgi:WD40 repeat protein/serine/threonine protein kinase
MSTTPARVESLFADALARLPEERAAFLAGACDGDRELHARIITLLGAHAGPETLLRGSVSPRDAPPAEKPGDTIGRYKLLQKIGEGGCGVVWMAEQEEPVRRRVALKVIKLGMDTKAVVARFEAERQALAMMDHPGIAKVHDAGSTNSGRPHFVMELVRGIPITSYCDENQLTPTARLELFIKVCQAVQHAHQKGVIHRDIKPSNILVAMQDGAPMPKVIDFGIAKATQGKLTDATVFTAFEQFIGTPVYMSPEQAEMSSLDIDTRSDIYSLGVLLYELLTGKLPFDPKSFAQAGVDQIRRYIREVEPPTPSRRLNTLGEDERTTIARLRGIAPAQLFILFRGDLDWIIMRCLEKDRTRRYDTANGLAMDIQRYLRHEPVVARPPSTGYLLQKWVRRHRVGFAAAAAVGCSLLAGLGISVRSLIQERAARERAVAAEREQIRLREIAQLAQAKEIQLRRSAEAHELAAREKAYVSDMNLLQQTSLTGTLPQARELLDRHRPRLGERDLRGWEWRYLWPLGQGEPRTLFCHQPYSIWSLSVSADGHWIAVGEREKGGLLVRNAETSQEFRPPAGNDYVTAVFSPRAPVLAISGTELTARGTVQSHFVILWNLTTQQVEQRFEFPARCVSLHFSSDGRVLVTSTESPDDTMTLWQIPGGRKLATYPVQQSFPGMIRYSISLTADLQRAAHRVAANKIRAVDLRTGTERWTAHAAQERIMALAFSPDGKILASSGGFVESAIRLWDVESGTEIGRLEGHRAWVSALVFRPDGRTLASASADQTIRLWDVPDRRVLKTLRGHRTEVWHLAQLPDLRLVSGGKDGTVYVWDTNASRAFNPAVTLPAEVRGWRFAADCKSVFTVDGDGNVEEWRGREFQERKPVMNIGRYYVARFSPQQPWLATGSQTGEIRLWDLERRGQIHELKIPAGDVHPVGFLGAGERLILFAYNPSRYFEWDLRTGREMATWPSPEEIRGWDPCFALSPDGSHGLMIGWNGRSAIRDLTTGRLNTFELAIRQVNGGTYSPDGRHFAASSTLGLAKLWNAATGREVAEFSGFLLGCRSVAFSPDGLRLATGSAGVDAIRLWDLESRRHLLTLEGKGSGFRETAFSSDGNVLGSLGGFPGVLHLWRAPSLEEIEAAEKSESTMSLKR